MAANCAGAAGTAASAGAVLALSASKTKTKKKHFVCQKVKLFRASEPLLSVLMWGANHTINELSNVPVPVMLMPDDFKAYSKIKVDNHLFNKENLPSRFKFKEYCPLVFRNLRERFGIDDQDYQGKEEMTPGQKLGTQMAVDRRIAMIQCGISARKTSLSWFFTDSAQSAAFNQMCGVELGVWRWLLLWGASPSARGSDFPWRGNLCAVAQPQGEGGVPAMATLPHSPV